MKKTLILSLIFTFIWNVQGVNAKVAKSEFDKYLSQFESVELPLEISHSLLSNWAGNQDSLKHISRPDIQKFFPSSLRFNIEAGDNIYGICKFQLNESVHSVIIASMSMGVWDGVTPTFGVYYLINYNTQGDIVDCILVAAYDEGNDATCKIDKESINQCFRTVFAHQVYNPYEKNFIYEKKTAHYRIDASGEITKTDSSWGIDLYDENATPECLDKHFVKHLQ